MKLTREQRNINKAIKARKNVRVTAVAGSGKTTTVLGLVGSKLNVLVLCYNNRLRAETQSRADTRAEELELFDQYTFHVHTFHSFCHSVLDEPLASTDIGIIKTVRAAEKDLTAFCMKHAGLFDYDVIIVDEAQDLNESYYRFIKILLACSEATLCLIGDPRQAIYQFNGSEEKYLESPEQYFGREFQSMTLSESFRLTKPMARFINGMYGIFRKSKKESVRLTESIETIKPYEDAPKAVRIRSSKKSKLAPLIVQGNPKVKDLVKFISKFEPKDILILMYSVKRNPNKVSVKLANELKQKGIAVSFGNVPTDPETDNSVLMISYHQSKGIERPIVILLDLNKFYFSITNESPLKVPNLWYVALSRASKYIVAYIDGPFTFVDQGLHAIGCPKQQGVPLEEPGELNWTAQRSFSNYMKYTPSIELWDQIQSGPKMPKTVVSPTNKQKIKDQLKITSGSILQEMIIDFLREPKNIVSGSNSNAYKEETFVDKYLVHFCGGLDIMPDIGKAYYEGYSSIAAKDALRICKEILIDTLADLGIDYRELGQVECLLGNHELYHKDTKKKVIVVTDLKTLDTRLRWSTCTDNDLLINVLSGSYSILSENTVPENISTELKE